MNTPKLIALCGWPQSGKTSIQDVLFREFEIVPMDDGEVIRKHCMELFGLTPDAVYTQRGKTQYTTIQGVEWENRKILGEYGNILEQAFGPYTIPNWAISTALKKFESACNQRIQGYSFGSVRREQGKVYRDAGARVIEVVRPGVKPTGNIWDEYNPTYITDTFVNDTDSLDEMREKFVQEFADLKN